MKQWKKTHPHPHLVLLSYLDHIIQLPLRHICAFFLHHQYTEAKVKENCHFTCKNEIDDEYKCERHEFFIEFFLSLPLWMNAIHRLTYYYTYNSYFLKAKWGASLIYSICIKNKLKCQQMAVSSWSFSAFSTAPHTNVEVKYCDRAEFHESLRNKFHNSVKTRFLINDALHHTKAPSEVFTQNTH